MFLISKKSFTKSRVGKTFLKHPISWQFIFFIKKTASGLRQENRIIKNYLFNAKEGRFESTT